MDKIVVAVDFSLGSLHSLDYAIHLSRKLHTAIDMVWVDNNTSDESSLTNISREIRTEVKKQFDDLISKKKTELEGISISFKMRKGKVYREIASQAKCETAGLIIAGSHGVSGFEQYWIGSNAYRIVSYSPCPVITLRSSWELRDSINIIVMPIDNTLETRYKVPKTAQLAAFFGAEVHVLAIQTTTVKAVERMISKYANEAARILQENNIPFQLKTLHTDSITNATIDYAIENNADLISIMTEKETASANIHLGAYAQQIINNSPIPVLTMNNKE